MAQNDSNVRVGIEVVSDTKGAKEAAEEIKKVGEAAGNIKADENGAFEKMRAEIEALKLELKTLQDSIKKTGESGSSVDPLKKSLSDLGESVSGLGREKAVGAIRGLQGVLSGLGGGDIQEQIGNLSQGLFSLAKNLPLPGATIAVPIALAALGAAYKVFGEDIFGAIRPVNEFGETLDEEMSRIESWANSQISWNNLKAANAELEQNFKDVKTAVEAATTAVEALYSARSAGKVAGLEAEAAAAGAAGEPGRQAEILKRVEDEKAKAELVKLNVAYGNQLAALEESKAQAAAQSKALQDTKAESEQSNAELEAIKAKVEEITGNIDATLESSNEQNALIQKLADQLTAQRLQAAGFAPIAQPEFGPAVSREDMAAAAEETAKLLEQVKNLGTIAKNAEADLNKYQEAQKAYEAAAGGVLTALATKKVELETLRESLAQATAGVDPAIAKQAEEEAARQIEAQTQLALQAINASKLTVDEIISAADGAGTKLIESAGGNAESITAAIALVQTPLAAIAPAVEAAEEPVKAAADGMVEIAGALATGAAEVVTATGDFQTKLGGAADGFQRAISQFGITAQALGGMGQNIAQSQLQLSRTVAGLVDGVNRALGQSALALQQIKNKR